MVALNPSKKKEDFGEHSKHINTFFFDILCEQITAKSPRDNMFLLFMHIDGICEAQLLFC